MIGAQATESGGSTTTPSQIVTPARPDYKKVFLWGAVGALVAYFLYPKHRYAMTTSNPHRRHKKRHKKKVKNPSRPLLYFINLDERGDFYSDIRDGDQGRSLIEIKTNYARELSDEGVNIRDPRSVAKHFIDLGVLPKGTALIKGN